MVQMGGSDGRFSIVCHILCGKSMIGDSGKKFTAATKVILARDVMKRQLEDLLDGML